MYRPFGWLRQRTYGLRSASSTRFVISAPRHPLPAVHARLHPVELREDVVGKVEPPVGEDVALDPAQDAERRQQLVRGRDLLGLAADVVRGEPADGAHGGRVVADREVVVAALAGGAAHLLDARPPVRPRRVAVQVAADVLRLDERRRLAAERLLAQLRRAPGDVERAVDRLLVGRVRQRLERRDVRGRARRAHERGPEPLRLGGDELDRHALDRHPHRAPLVLLDHRDDLGQRGEARQHGARIRRGADHRQQLAGVAPAPHVAGRLAVERGRDASDELPGAVEQEPAPRSRLGLAGERLEQLRLGLRPDARDGPQPARGRRLAKLVGGADAERPRELDRALRAEPEVAAEADEIGRELALELRQLGDLARLDELAQPRLDPRADPAQLARPPGPHELGDRERRAADRLGGAAVGAGRVRVRLGELEQRRERVQAVGDLGIVHRR